MASLLRSGKFVRFFSNITRSIDLNNGGRNNSETLLCARREGWNFKLHKSLATVQLPLKNLNDAPSSQAASPADPLSLDQALARLDLDIHKAGRLARADILAVVERVKQLKSISPTQSLLLIRGCGSLIAEDLPSERNHLVQSIWRMLKDLQVPMDISHYNALLRVYLENENKFKPMDFLAQLEQNGIEPNRVTYQRLMAAYCQQGNIEGASQILEIMKTKDLPIGETVFNSLVMGHANIGDMESARGVIAVMSQAGLQPDADTYCALLCGFAKHGLLQEIIATLSECDKNDIFISDRELFEVVYSAALHGHSEMVTLLLKRMRKSTGYNQECCNVILRLINQKKEEDAYTIFMTMRPSVRLSGQKSVVGSFFIRQLVKAGYPADVIVKFCQRLVDSGMNDRAFMRALESANDLGHVELAVTILKNVKGSNSELRPSMFWPLLNSQAKIKGESGVLNVLKQMSAAQVSPSFDTINLHVLPHFSKDNLRNLLTKLRSADVPSSLAIVALLLQSLERKDFDSAIELCQYFKIQYANDLVRKTIISAYFNTKDAASVAKVVHAMVHRQLQIPGDEAQPKKEPTDLCDLFVREAYDFLPMPKLASLEPLLKAFRDQGMTISQSTVQYIQEKASDEMTDSVAEILTELGSGKLTLVEIQPLTNHFPNRSNMSSKRLEEIRQAKFINLIRERKFEDAIEYKKVLEEMKVPFTPAMLALLAEIYSSRGHHDEAMAIFNQHFCQPGNCLNPVKNLYLAANLMKAERSEDALKVLEKLSLSDKFANVGPDLSSIAWRVMNYAAEKGDVELTQKLFDAIINSKALPVGNLILSPLVKVHIVRNDIDSALKKIVECAETYRFTPMKVMLMEKLIETEDAQKLQELMDVSIKVHTELNSLYDLVFAFLNCGRIRQAKKVLETPGLRAHRQKLETACLRYAEAKRITELENLVKITRDVLGVNRAKMFEHLLTAYINVDDPLRAKDLLDQMQEEDCQPTPNFLRRLANFMKEKNVPVSFVVPEEDEIAENIAINTAQAPRASRAVATEAKPLETVSKNEKASTANARNSAVKMLVEQQSVDGALEFTRKAEKSGTKVTAMDKSYIIEELVKQQRLSEAQQLVIEMLKSDSYPTPRIFRFFIQQLKLAGDVESFKDLEKYLTEKHQRMLSYENIKSSLAANDTTSASAYIEDLMKNVKALTAESDSAERQEKAKALASKFPRGGLISILQQNPELLGKCKEIASEYLKLGSYEPTNALWCYYVIGGRKEDADLAWSTLKQSTSAIGFTSICRHARQQSDVEVAESLVQTLSSAPHIKSSALGIAYSCYIDILVNKSMLDEANAALNQALEKSVKLSEINSSAINRLKNAFHQANRPFSLDAVSDAPSTSTPAESNADTPTHKPADSK